MARRSFLQTKQQNSFNFIFVILGKVYFKKIDGKYIHFQQIHIDIEYTEENSYVSTDVFVRWKNLLERRGL